MSLEQELIKIKKEIEQAKAKLIRLETEREMKLKQLQLFGAKTLTEAEKLIKQWEKKRDQAEEQLQDFLQQIEEQYGKVV